MVQQTIGSVTFGLKEAQDFSWLDGFGRVFCVFDQLISGNLCFGVENPKQRLFIKYAGANTLMYAGQKQAAMEKLAAAGARYRSLSHPALSPLLYAQAFGEGYALVFPWFDGFALAPLENHLHRLQAFPLRDKLRMFDSMMDFLVMASGRHYLAAGLSHRHILVDFEQQRAIFSSVDNFMQFPVIAPYPKLPGSTWFLPPEAYKAGQSLQESANVYMIGALAFTFFGDSYGFTKSGWTGGRNLFALANQAVLPNPGERVQTASDFQRKWRDTVLATRDI